MNLGELLEICEAYDSLGWAVQDQLKKMVDATADGTDPEEISVNGNAVNLIEERFIRKAYRSGNEELQDDIDALKEFIARMRGEVEDDDDDLTD